MTDRYDGSPSRCPAHLKGERQASIRQHAHAHKAGTPDSTYRREVSGAVREGSVRQDPTHRIESTRSDRASFATTLPTIDLSDDSNIMDTGSVSRRSLETTRYAQKASRTSRHGAHAMEVQARLGDKPHSRQKKKRRWLSRLVALFVLATLGFGGFQLWHSGRLDGLLNYLGIGIQQSGSEVESGTQVNITIAEGESAVSIASKLEEKGVISSSSDFLTAVQKQGVDASLKPGDYLFIAGTDVQNVIDLLVSGPNVSSGYTLTIPEGKTIEQTAAIVEDTMSIPADDFLAQAKASNYVADYSFLEDASNTEYDSLEGYLYPKTYSFDIDASADEVIRAMLDQYQIEVSSLDFDAAREAIESSYGTVMSDYDFITMASIIEKEALTDNQRQKVASVFYNRFKVGMVLNSDATLSYVTGTIDDADELNTNTSPYNTYLYEGLPPTPICSPQLASIEAALDPEETDYLYFWITQDDAHFSETYEEHISSQS